jgi:hypothetical protein
MCIALAAGNRSPIFAQARVTYFDDVLLGNGLPETWPSRAGFELGLRTEDCIIAADAAAEAAVVIVPGVLPVLLGAYRSCEPQPLVKGIRWNHRPSHRNCQKVDPIQTRWLAKYVFAAAARL